MPTKQDMQWAMGAHLSALAGGFVTGGLGIFIGPLAILLLKRDDLPFAADQAKEALNFSLTLLLAGAALGAISVLTFGVGLVVTVPVAIILGIAWFVLTIVAAVRASEGVAYRYPLTLRLIR
jgi:uncharacterized protein